MELIPLPIGIHIFGYLDSKSYKSFFCVCKSFQKLGYQWVTSTHNHKIQSQQISSFRIRYPNLNEIIIRAIYPNGLLELCEFNNIRIVRCYTPTNSYQYILSTLRSTIIHTIELYYSLDPRSFPYDIRQKQSSDIHKFTSLRYLKLCNLHSSFYFDAIPNSLYSLIIDTKKYESTCYIGKLTCLTNLEFLSPLFENDIKLFQNEIPKLKSLKRLFLKSRGDHVHAIHVSMFSGLVNLEYLDLQFLQTTTPFIAKYDLSNDLQKLTFLCLQSYGNELNYDPFAKITSLKKYICDFQPLSIPPNVIDLSIIRKPCVSQIPHIPHLQILDLDCLMWLIYIGSTSDFLNNISNVENLTYLPNSTNDKLWDFNGNLHLLTNLTRLKIREYTVKRVELNSIKECSKLVELEIPDSTAPLSCYLTVLPKLERLIITEMMEKDKFLDVPISFPNFNVIFKQ